jgi:hypothetical protein
MGKSIAFAINSNYGINGTLHILETWFVSVA